jgi:hypothetical protein
VRLRCAVKAMVVAISLGLTGCASTQYLVTDTMPPNPEEYAEIVVHRSGKGQGGAMPFLLIDGGEGVGPRMQHHMFVRPDVLGAGVHGERRDSDRGYLALDAARFDGAHEVCVCLAKPESGEELPRRTNWPWLRTWVPFEILTVPRDDFLKRFCLFAFRGRAVGRLGVKGTLNWYRKPGHMKLAVATGPSWCGYAGDLKTLFDAGIVEAGRRYEYELEFKSGFFRGPSGIEVRRISQVGETVDRTLSQRWN